jgi:hypothetical protein
MAFDIRDLPGPQRVHFFSVNEAVDSGRPMRIITFGLSWSDDSSDSAAH